MTTVLIVDDHGAYRQQARALLEAEGLIVVGEAADAKEATEAARAFQPDLVLLDIGLPDVDGFEVAARLAAMPRPPRVVLISTREAESYGPRLASSPTIGFLRKDDLSAAALMDLLGQPVRWRAVGYSAP